MKDISQPIVIVGGGFTGLFTALHLRHQKCSRPVILIDQQWRFIFKPLLYELLTSEVQLDIVWPRYDELLIGSDITFIHDRVEGIDLSQGRVTLNSGLNYDYQYLVLALGSTTGYFGIQGAKENTFSFREGDDVFKLGSHLRDCLQRATQETDPIKKQQLLTVAIVGAGPVGVELAATLADLLPIWDRALGGDAQELQIVVVQRGQSILKGDTNSRLRPLAEQQLQVRTASVKLLLNATVQEVVENEIRYQQDNRQKTLSAATIVWTAGTVTHPLIKDLPLDRESRDRHGKLIINAHGQLPNFPEVFAGGDCGTNPDNPQPALAQVAYQQAKGIATNIKALCEAKELKPIEVSLRGTLLKLGMSESVAEIYGRVEIKGKAGHLIRQTTYLEMLPTPLRNFKATAQWLTDSIFQSFS